MNAMRLGLFVLGLSICLLSIPCAAIAGDCGCRECAKSCATCKPDCGTPCGKCPKCGEFPQTDGPEGFHEIPLPDMLSPGIDLDCCCPHSEYRMLCGCGQDYTICPWPEVYELLCDYKKPCNPCKRHCKHDTCAPDKCGYPKGEPVEWDD